MRCSLCLTVLNDGQSLTTTSCGHVFHSPCFDMLHSHTFCPVCRASDISTVQLFGRFENTASTEDSGNNSTLAVELAEFRHREVVRDRELARVQNELLQEREQRDMFEQQHKLQWAGCSHDTRQCRDNSLRSEEENLRLREENQSAREIKKRNQELAEHVERVDKRNTKLREHQSHLREAIHQHTMKVRTHSWGEDKIMVRNYASSALVEPRTTIRTLLRRLRVPATDEQITIVEQGELWTKPGRYQVTVAFTDIRIKVEALAKSRTLAEHENSEVRFLEIIDPLEMRALYKRANTKLRTGNGVSSLKLRNNQIIVQTRPSAEIREIQNDAHITEIAEYMINHCQHRQREKRRKNKANKKQTQSAPDP